MRHDIAPRYQPSRALRFRWWWFRSDVRAALYRWTLGALYHRLHFCPFCRAGQVWCPSPSLPDGHVLGVEHLAIRRRARIVLCIHRRNARGIR